MKDFSNYTEEELYLYSQTEKLDVLHKIKLDADDIYYNTGKQSIEDWQYDIIRDALSSRDPTYTVPIGVKIRKNENRVTLPYWLGSMDKMSVQSAILYYFSTVENDVRKKYKNLSGDALIKKVEEMWDNLSDSEKEKYNKLVMVEFEKELDSWIRKNPSDEYILEDKLDGVSCLVTVKNGKVKLYTRGDGIIGADISYLAQYFKSIPKNLTKDVNIRGELIMKVDTFKKKHSAKYANPRNMVSGLIGAKTMRQGLEDVDFIAYEVINTVDDVNKVDKASKDNNAMKPSDQLDMLDILGFTTVRRKLADNISATTLIEAFASFKNDTPYEIDGLIVQPNKPYKRNVDGNPEYAFAFKMRLSGNLVETTVVDVEWNVSKWGQLKPRVQIEPVNIGGVTITYASGFNAKYIDDNKIGPGAKIKVTRSGDVIPFIVEIIKPAKKAALPNISYKWNETGVDIYTDEYEDEMCIKLIANFFSKLGVKHVGEKNIEKIYKHGYDTLLKIIAASKEDFAQVSGFGDRLAERTWDNIHNGLKELSLPVVLGASGIFGFGLGTRKVTALFNDFPDILSAYKNMTHDELYNRILQVEGFSDKSTLKIVSNIEWADKFIKALGEFATYKIKPKRETQGNQGTQGTQETNKLLNLTVVFSGFRDKVLEEQVVAQGGKVTTSVSKNTNIVVVTSKAGNPTAKVQKAIDLGIKILTKEEFKVFIEE